MAKQPGWSVREFKGFHTLCRNGSLINSMYVRSKDAAEVQRWADALNDADELAVRVAAANEKLGLDK